MGNFMDEVTAYLENLQKKTPLPYAELIAPDVYMFLRVKVKLLENDYSVEPDDVPERMDQLQEALKEATALLVSMAKYLDTITAWQEQCEKEMDTLQRQIDELKRERVIAETIRTH